MSRLTIFKSYNKLIIGLIVTEFVIRQFVSIGGVILMGILTLALFILIKKYMETNSISLLWNLLFHCLCFFVMSHSNHHFRTTNKSYNTSMDFVFSLFCFSNYNITFISTIKKEHI